jgi:hypothetical protein
MKGRKLIRICSKTAWLVLVLIAPALSCGAGRTNQGTTPEWTGSTDRLDRLRFNQMAVTLNLPLFWEADRNGNNAADPDEVRSLMFYPAGERWTENGAFTPAFRRAYSMMVELERLHQVRLELGTTAPTLVASDLTSLPDDHRAFARHMLTVGGLIDQLYARQMGMTALADQVSTGEAESMSLFRRNWGAACRGPSTESESACSAIAGAPTQPVDVYPAAIQAQDQFCQSLETHADSATLLTPFTVVREREGSLVAVPYTEAYAEEMQAVAAELRAAADALTDPEEEALRTYLRAAAQAFGDNNWEPADEAWANMNARNSRWYLRVAPDEVYWEPCSQKAGFHMTLALINRDSLAWQDRLTPLQNAMEGALAGLVETYEPREVAFHMPDFIDIVVNSGDDRNAFGATIGQSLPNWGPVAEEGRGRTVAMSNLYTDTDSVNRSRAIASSLIGAEAMQLFTESPESGLMSTILHEACHNLGPSHEYRVEGRTDDEVFGGGMASMLEELKAQTGALFLIGFLRQQNVITEQQQRETYLDSLIWAMGHISRGMYTPSGGRKAYSQLAAIQFGYLMDQGVIRFDPTGTAANGTDQGAFTIDFDALPAAVEQLMTIVMEIKSTGDTERADQLAAQYVDGDIVPQSIIAERVQRFPRATLVYALEL